MRFRRTGHNSVCLLLTLVSALALAVMSAPVCADDKSGVSPTTISRPTGPGSLEGLGDAFQPALNTGTAQYTVNITLPEGVAGFTPALSLRYDSGRGFGAAGIGWSFGPGSIRRQTEKGLPRYVDPPADTPDRFIGMNGEELVPLANGYYLAKIESAFIRYRRVGGHWEAHAKNGTTFQFGLTVNARLTDIAGARIYQWCLERQTDVHGNVIEYDYVLPDEQDRQIYLSAVRYGPGGPPWAHYYSVTVTYEDRPDFRTDYRSGFRVRTTKRISQIDVNYDDTLIRRYALGYGTHPHWSLLTTIAQYGDDGLSALPVTAFEYATFDIGDPSIPLSASQHVIGSTGEPGSVVDNAKVDLIDINADGLPDLLQTDAGHLAYLNHGVREVEPGVSAISWEGPLAVAASDGRPFNFELSDDNVHLADMTGDGIADLVATEPDWIEFFPNSGHVGWDDGRLMSVGQSPPPAPFGPDGQSVLTSDLDFDKRIDVIKSDYGVYSVWFNLGGGAFSDEVLTNGAWHGQQFIDFAAPGVDLADMNGDRLNDVVKVTPISVVFCANMGFGEFDQYVEMPLPDRWLDDSPGGNLHRAQLTDVNGDGLADLVVERAEGDNLWFWLNMGNNSLSLSRVITDLPATPGAATRWVDINGNGTTDLVYADSALPDSKMNAVDLGELIAGSSHLNALIGIDNGYGRHTAISYRSTTDFYVGAWEIGHPWTCAVPFPVAVVSGTRTSIGLDLDGYPDEGPDGDTYLTDYVYRDGYYDPSEKQFRGFAFVKEIHRGDERFGGSRAPTLVTRHGFHTGAPDGLDNDGDGYTDEYHEWNGREEEPLKGVELWQEACSLPDDPVQDGTFCPTSVVFERLETDWDIREVSTAAVAGLADLFGEGYCTADDYGRSVRHAVPVRQRRSIVERQTEPGTHKRLETRSDIDSVGNKRFDWNLGDLDNSGDDLYTGYEYALDETHWLLDRVSRIVQRVGAADGAFVSEVRNYYDGLPFQGLPLGAIDTVGRLHRSESLVSGGEVPELTQRSFLRGDPRAPAGAVNTQRQRFDDFGNVVVILDADATLGLDGMPDGNGHERSVEYDPDLHKFPVRETIVVGNGNPDLAVQAEYHYGFGSPIAVTDFNGNATHYRYDTFGRLVGEVLPGDDPSTPTHTYSYSLGAPVSSIATTSHAREGDSPDVVTRKFFDGLGRALGVFEAGGPVMKGVTQYTPRGQAWKVFQPYLGEPLDGDGSWLLPAVGLAATVTAYDSTGRVVQIVTPPDEHAVMAHARTDYLPLTVVQYDGEDNNSGGSHANTPKTFVSDGLGRLIKVHEIEMLSSADSGTFTTKYRYVLPDLLAEIEDSNGNIKYMRYDGLGRRLFMNDCDRGHMTYAYDSAGNLLNSVDAKGQQINYTYDGANRSLTEDYVDNDAPTSTQERPEVAYHYDCASPDYPALRNLRGRLAWVEDSTGAEFRGFDARGSRETLVKRVGQADGSTMEWTTTSLTDSVGRIYEIVHPDGNIVRQSYDARGLPQATSGFVEELTYHPSGQKATCALSNGVTTEYTYDSRLRLIQLATQSEGEWFQDLSYEYDQAGNMLGITDERAMPPGDPRSQTAGFVVDNSYRLLRANGAAYGTIEYDYDRLGNMTTKLSGEIVDPDMNISTMISGGAGGTTSRVGRAAGDPPGPHALTSAHDGQGWRVYAYDDNGNMTFNDGDEYAYDFRDRLATVTRNGRDTNYLYDYTDRRVAKRGEDSQTTYISSLSEMREGKLLNYVFAGNTRVARFEGSLPPPERVSQRIALGRGWNLFSFQLTTSSNDPAAILADVSRQCVVVFGHDGGDYTRFEPDAVDNTLTQLLPNHGYWMYMTEPGELLIEGSMNETSVRVPKGGFALIGLPGLAHRGIPELRSQYPTMMALWTYLGDDVGWRMFDARSPDYMNTLAGTTPGAAYWAVFDNETLIDHPPSSPTQISYYHGDHLGSTSIVTDADGAIIRETVYYPFGTPRYEHTSDPEVRDPHYGFTGKERDQESGLNYFEARYYASAYGRFISVDQLLVSVPDLRRPQGHNLYSYVGNQPLVYLDPTGNDWESFFLTSAPKPSSGPELAVKTAGLFAPKPIGAPLTAVTILLHVDQLGQALIKTKPDAEAVSEAVDQLADDLVSLVVPPSVDQVKSIAEVSYTVPSYLLDRLDDYRFHGSRMEPAKEPVPALGMKMPPSPESVRQAQRMEQALAETRANRAPAQVLGPAPTREQCPSCYDPNVFHGTDPDTGKPLPPLGAAGTSERRGPETLGLEGIGD